MRDMKAFKIFVVFLIALGLLLYFSPPVRNRLIGFVYSSECDAPLPYKLGSLDPRFGLNQTTATADLQAAVDIWNKAYGKPIFLKSSTAPLTVNFIYDERSALNSQITSLQNKLNVSDTSLQKQITAYQTDETAFEQKLKAFNAKVDQINQSGGAPPDQYNSLISEQNTLAAEGNALNDRASQLSLATHNYNSQVKTLNQNVSLFNQEITQKPEEGVYDNGSDTITIYFAANKEELTHTLAHEFGHALGMQHTSDPKSIMNPGTTTFLDVTTQDQEELNSVCKKQLFPPRKLEEWATWARSVVNAIVPSK